MRKEIMEKWVEALPKYKQGQGHLHVEDRFCCFGVLCEVAKENGVIAEYRGSDSYAPSAVLSWAGLRDPVGYFGFHEDGHGYPSLVSLNDGGENFEAIAGVIKKYWEVL